MIRGRSDPVIRFVGYPLMKDRTNAITGLSIQQAELRVAFHKETNIGMASSCCSEQANGTTGIYGRPSNPNS
jgi:hypothetical protein